MIGRTTIRLKLSAAAAEGILPLTRVAVEEAGVPTPGLLILLVLPAAHLLRFRLAQEEHKTPTELIHFLIGHYLRLVVHVRILCLCALMLVCREWALQEERVV